MIVTVAPNGYSGRADYYCTGVNDDILINAAIQYVYSAYGGGEVKLLDGVFNTTGVISGADRVTLSGSGPGTIVKLGACITAIYFNAIYGVVGNLTVDVSSAPSQSPAAYVTGVNYVGNWGRIESVSVVGTPPGSGFIGISLGGDDLIVTNCIVDAQGGTSSGLHSYGIIAAGQRSVITNNIVTRLHCLDFEVVGIRTDAGFNCIVSTNHVYDLQNNSATQNTVGIQVGSSYSLISDNRIEEVKNAGTAAKAFGISVSGTSDSIQSNYCYNNGSDAGILNTNGKNFSNSGTNTQATNNSWQGPEEGFWRDIAYTPTFTGFGTATNVNFFWSRVGNRIKVMGKFTAGITTATEARISLPVLDGVQLLSDSTLIPSIMICGTGGTNTASGSVLISLIESGVGYITLGFSGAGGGNLAKQNGNTWVTGIIFSLVFEFPISGWNA